MVNLLGKRDNGLAYVKKSLEDNLKINPASSRLIDVNNADAKVYKKQFIDMTEGIV